MQLQDKKSRQVKSDLYLILPLTNLLIKFPLSCQMQC